MYFIFAHKKCRQHAPSFAALRLLKTWLDVYKKKKVLANRKNE
jgi:hypothetical protein